MKNIAINSTNPKKLSKTDWYKTRRKTSADYIYIFIIILVLGLIITSSLIWT